jgi:hypothetical protein
MLFGCIYTGQARILLGGLLFAIGIWLDLLELL